MERTLPTLDKTVSKVEDKEEDRDQQLKKK